MNAPMDLATRFLQWREQPPEQWARAANRYLPQVASAVLVLALAYQLAQLTWALVPGSPPDAPTPIVSTPTGTAPSSTNVGGGIDVTGIIEDHLFGVASREPVPVVEDVVDAPDTSLSLQLKGTHSDPLDSRWGAAIIADGRGEEKTYTVSDAIDGGGGAQLHSIYIDRVILNRAGRLETLRLPQELTSSNVTIARRPAPPAPPAQQSLQNVLTENASRITDVIRVAPHIEQGQMVGFRINPGREREQFDALGLQPGDVVTDINGTAMTDPTRGLQVFESLGESTQANVTIVRNGVPEVLTIDTSQLDQLAEDRQ